MVIDTHTHSLTPTGQDFLNQDNILEYWENFKIRLKIDSLSLQLFKIKFSLER